MRKSENGEEFKPGTQSRAKCISDLVRLAKVETSGDNQEFEIGVVPNFQAQTINQKTKIVVLGGIKTISKEGIVHAIKRHGNDIEESERGQKGVTDKDFELIPNVLLQPDDIRNGGKNSRGQDSILFIKTINKLQYHAVMCVKTKKGKVELSFSTLYIKK